MGKGVLQWVEVPKEKGIKSTIINNLNNRAEHKEVGVAVQKAYGRLESKKQ